MLRRLFLLLFLFLLLVYQELGAQNKANSPTLSIYADTSVNPWADVPKMLQQTDMRLSISPSPLFIPLPGFRIYTLQSLSFDTIDSDKLQPQNFLVPRVIGVGVYDPKGIYRFLYGSLSINGIEERMQNLWDKAFILPASCARASADLYRTTSLQQKKDTAGWVSIPLGEKTILYTLLHNREEEHLHGTIGFETNQIDGKLLRIEAGIGYNRIPETSADTWFSSTPFRPDRYHYITSISLQWFGSWMQIIGDMASSYTPWEGIGYYWKGAITLGPTSFRLSAGYDTIQGPFRDSVGSLQVKGPHEEKDRCRFQMYMKNKTWGNLILNSETRFCRDEITKPYYVDECKNYVYFTKGQVFTPWWIFPASTTLRANYIKNDDLPYSGTIVLNHKLRDGVHNRQRQGKHSITWDATMQNRIVLYSDQAQMWLSKSLRELQYSCEGVLGLHFKSISTQIGTTITKEGSSLQQESINLKLSYSKKYFNISSAVNIPLIKKADGNIQLSMNWTW
jgi:hypothetical protein